MSEIINVLFEIPDWVSKGLENGSLERVGGVIRDSSTRAVKAWLREGEKTDFSTENTFTRETGIPTQMMMGLQVANLAVSVIGFTLLHRKLRKVEVLLYRIDETVQETSRDVRWIDRKEMIKEIATIKSALKSLKDSGSYLNSDAARRILESELQNIQRAGIYFHDVLQNIFEDKLEFERSEEATVCYQAWVISNMGRFGILQAIKELNVAHMECVDFTQEHAEIGRKLKGCILDHYRRITATECGYKRLRELAHRAKCVHELVCGNVLLLQWSANTGISLLEKDVKELDEYDGFVLCHITDDEEGDT